MPVLKTQVTVSSCLVALFLSGSQCIFAQKRAAHLFCAPAGTYTLLDSSSTLTPLVFLQHPGKAEASFSGSLLYERPFFGLRTESGCRLSGLIAARREALFARQEWLYSVKCHLSSCAFGFSKTACGDYVECSLDAAPLSSRMGYELSITSQGHQGRRWTVGVKCQYALSASPKERENSCWQSQAAAIIRVPARSQRTCQNFTSRGSLRDEESPPEDRKPLLEGKISLLAALGSAISGPIMATPSSAEALSGESASRTKPVFAETTQMQGKGPYDRLQGQRHVGQLSSPMGTENSEKLGPFLQEVDAYFTPSESVPTEDNAASQLDSAMLSTSEWEPMTESEAESGLASQYASDGSGASLLSSSAELNNELTLPKRSLFDAEWTWPDWALPGLKVVPNALNPFDAVSQTIYPTLPDDATHEERAQLQEQYHALVLQRLNQEQDAQAGLLGELDRDGVQRYLRSRGRGKTLGYLWINGVPLSITSVRQCDTSEQTVEYRLTYPVLRTLSDTQEMGQKQPFALVRSTIRLRRSGHAFESAWGNEAPAKDRPITSIDTSLSEHVDRAKRDIHRAPPPEHGASLLSPVSTLR